MPGLLISEQFITFTSQCNSVTVGPWVRNSRTTYTSQTTRPSAWEYDFIWKQDLCRWNQFDVRTQWLVSLKQAKYHMYPYPENSSINFFHAKKKREENLDKDTQKHTRENAMWPQRQRLEWCICKPRNAKGCQEPAEAKAGKEGCSPRAFWGTVALPTPWVWNSGVQNHENTFLLF